jgi:hypothetical protein
MIISMKSRNMSWVGHVALMGEMTNAYNILVGRHEGMRPLKRLGRRCEDDIKAIVKETGCELDSYLA